MGACPRRGWIRKFADGTNDWSTHRLNINLSDLSCINTQSKLQYTKDPESDLLVNNDNYYGEFSKLCLSPADNNGCIQSPISKSEKFEIESPRVISLRNLTVTTLPDENPHHTGMTLQVNGLSSDTPYLPTPLRHDENLSNIGPFNYFHSSDFHLAIRVIVPVYISVLDDKSPGNIQNVKVTRMKDGSRAVTSTLTASSPITCSGDVQLENTYCLSTVDGKVVLDVKVSPEQSGLPNDSIDNNNFDYAGLEIEFKNQNIQLSSTNPMKPGNDLYYLTRLARLELLGIPQIAYEPIYCNSNKSKLIPGIYNEQTRSSFDLNSSRYDIANHYKRDISQIYDPSANDSEANPTSRVVGAEGINKNQIWSDNEFMCCLNLGEETDDAGLCCSGYATDNSDTSTQKTCKLPTGANLNVYFNKFVSGDGMGKDQPGGGFNDNDFIPETGEIKLTESAYTKVKSFGASYCESGKTRGGAVFGYFYAAPNTGYYNQNGTLEDSKMWSITDSTDDYDESNDTGYGRFLDGYRWNQHTYCE